MGHAKVPLDVLVAVACTYPYHQEVEAFVVVVASNQPVQLELSYNINSEDSVQLFLQIDIYKKLTNKRSHLVG